jgi:UDP-N-acetylmuramate dehydrogenase
MNQKLDNLQTKPAKELSSLRVGDGEVRFLSVTSIEDMGILHTLYKDGERIHITGRGTNSVYGTYSGVVVSIDIMGHEWLENSRLKIYTGEDWQTAVDLSLNKGLHGIERLTMIPGTVGAAPIQNIGAFGQLLSNRLHSVEVYDYIQNKTITLSAQECGFGAHRASNFKNMATWDSYVVTSITIDLLPESTFEPPSGEGLMQYAQEYSLPFASVKDAEQLIRSFRATLYPDYRQIPNCGSYFTNYEVDKELAQKLPSSIWKVKHRDARDGSAVLFQCKDLLHSVGIDAGHEFSGGLKMHPKFNNFLINTGGATALDLLACHKEVNDLLAEKYGIALIPEPEFVDDATARPVM